MAARRSDARRSNVDMKETKANELCVHCKKVGYKKI